MKKTLLLLLGLIIIGVVIFVPNGVQLAFSNNVWSTAYITHSLPAADIITVPLSPSVEHPHAWLLLAREAISDQDYERALELLQPYVPTTDPVVLETAAELLFMLKRYPEALNIWKELGMFNKLEHAASALFSQNETSMGILALRNASELQPEIYRPILIQRLLSEGDILREQDQFDEAVSSYEQIISEFPNFSEPYSRLAMAYYLQGEMEQAENALDRGMKIHPSSYSFYMTAGQIFEKSERWDRALTAYQNALEISPDSREPLLAIERISGPR